MSTEHMVLTAMLAEKEQTGEECILAALFHDIGHLLGTKAHLQQMEDWGTTDHDIVGADYLRSHGFPEKVCKLVLNHVLAKRYLASKTKDPDHKYYNALSKASQVCVSSFPFSGFCLEDMSI